jgi:predicted nucleic acid-binding protein
VFGSNLWCANTIAVRNVGTRDTAALKTHVVPGIGGQFRKLTLKSQHRGPGPIDLLVAATAVHHGLTVLHVDNDFVTIASVLSELRQQDIRS